MSSSITPLCTALVLTSSQTDATYTAVVEGYVAHTLDFTWTPGTSGNVLTVTIFHRVNAVTNGAWTQEMHYNENPAGTWTPQLDKLTVTATGTVAVPYYYFFQGHYGEVKIQVSESTAGGVTLGTISAYLTSSNKS